VVHAFCVMNMPVSVPVRAVIDANISLFHLPRNAMWAISRIVRLMVMAIANFTPRTKRSSGVVSVVSLVLRWLVLRVNAFLIGSFMVHHLLLFYAFCAGAFSAD